MAEEKTVTVRNDSPAPIGFCRQAEPDGKKQVVSAASIERITIAPGAVKSVPASLLETEGAKRMLNDLDIVVDGVNLKAKREEGERAAASEREAEKNAKAEAAAEEKAESDARVETLQAELAEARSETETVTANFEERIRELDQKLETAGAEAAEKANADAETIKKLEKNLKDAKKANGK